MAEPFLGELRVLSSHYEAVYSITPGGVSNVHFHQPHAVPVNRLEQWNGKEWVFVCEIRSLLGA